MADYTTQSDGQSDRRTGNSTSRTTKTTKTTITPTTTTTTNDQGNNCNYSSADHNTRHTPGSPDRGENHKERNGRGKHEGKEEEEGDREREKERGRGRQQSAETPEARNHSPSSRANKRKIIGFDNSDKNAYRRSLGSCTDRVADERVKYGAWQTPDAEKQRRLIEHLAPYKPAHPPDPRFNTWVNHFDYYWRIGVDRKPTRRRTDRHSSTGSSSNDTAPNSSTSGVEQGGRLYRTQHHRYLVKRPKTTPGRMMDANDTNDVSNSNSNSNSNNRSQGENGVHPQSAREERIYKVYSSGSARGGVPSSRGQSEGTLDSSRSLPYISGLDRRYMGLQSVDGHQMKDIVGRLTRMTSAYHAKFAPNPHVWIDNSPGAHMVGKRENTIG